MPDDAELLRRYVETRSEPAFAALVERHLGLVYSAALRRLGGDPHCATEAAQNVFIALARHAPALARRPVLASWLHTATRHAALDLRRAEHRRLTRQHTALALAAVNTPNSDNDLEWDRLRPLLDAALDELNETDRTLLLLRFFEQHPFATIGAQLRLTEDAARIRTARALEKLRAHLARHGITSTAAALGVALAAQPLTAAPAGLAASLTAGAFASTTFTGTALGLPLMTATTKTLLATVALVTTLAIGTAVYQSRRAEHALHLLTDLQQERDTLNRQNSELDSRLKASAAALVRATTQQKEAGTKPAPTGTLSTPPNTPVRSMWSYPGALALYVAKQRAALNLRYGQFYRSLNLTPDQIAKFEKSQTELQQSLADIWSEASARGLNTGDSSVARLTTEPHSLLKTSLVALLGEDGYAKYTQYEKDRSARDVVTSLAGNIYYSEPLNSTQGTALAGILVANTKVERVPMKDEGKNTLYTVRNETDWSAVTSQAQGLLSESQLTALKSLVEQQRLDAAMIELQNPRNQPKQ